MLFKVSLDKFVSLYVDCVFPALTGTGKEVRRLYVPDTFESWLL